LVGEDTGALLAIIEDSFAVKLGNYWEFQGITVEQLARKINDQAGYPAPYRCLSSVAFYELRKALSAVIQIPRRTIRPSTTLETLLNWRERKKNWRAVEARLGLTLPNLTCPRWLGILCLVLPALVLIYLRGFRGVPLTALQIVFGSFALMIPMAFACIPITRILPRNCESVGDLARIVLVRNYSSFAARWGSSCKKGILPALQLLIGTATDRDLREITPDTRITTDLGID
jgi:hypothetical protein